MPISAYQAFAMEYDAGYEAGFKAGYEKAMSSKEDAVQVVRCGECRYMNPDGSCECFADSRIRPSVSDFCSNGQRRDG